MDEVAQGTGKVPLIALAVVLVTALGLGLVVVLDAVGDDRTAPERAVSDWWQAVAEGDCDVAVSLVADAALSDFVPSASNREEALAGCEQMRNRESSLGPEAEEVREVDRDSAWAEVEVTYEPAAAAGELETYLLDDDNRLRVQVLHLVEEDGEWLIDQLAQDVALSDREVERAD